MEGVPSARAYAGGFNAALMLKDLRLALQLAESTHQPAPLGEAVSQLYAQVRNTKRHGTWRACLSWFDCPVAAATQCLHVCQPLQVLSTGFMTTPNVHSTKLTG